MKKYAKFLVLLVPIYFLMSFFHIPQSWVDDVIGFFQGLLLFGLLFLLVWSIVFRAKLVVKGTLNFVGREIGKGIEQAKKNA